MKEAMISHKKVNGGYLAEANNPQKRCRLLIAEDVYKVWSLHLWTI